MRKKKAAEKHRSNRDADEKLNCDPNDFSNASPFPKPGTGVVNDDWVGRHTHSLSAINQ